MSGTVSLAAFFISRIAGAAALESAGIAIAMGLANGVADWGPPLTDFASPSNRIADSRTSPVTALSPGKSVAQREATDGSTESG